MVCEKSPTPGLDRLQDLDETPHEHGRVTNEVRTVGPVTALGPLRIDWDCPTTPTCCASSGCGA